MARDAVDDLLSEVTAASLPRSYWCLLTGRCTYYLDDEGIQKFLDWWKPREKSSLNGVQEVYEFTDLVGLKVGVTMGAVTEWFYSTLETRERERRMKKAYDDEEGFA